MRSGITVKKLKRCFKQVMGCSLSCSTLYKLLKNTWFQTEHALARSEQLVRALLCAEPLPVQSPRFQTLVQAANPKELVGRVKVFVRCGEREEDCIEAQHTQK